MGGLLAAASISGFIGLFAMVISLKSGGTGGAFLFIALAINVAAIIRLFVEKRNYENTKFRTLQLVYIISGIICAIAGSYVIFCGWKSSVFISVLFYIGFVVMLFTGTFVGIHYLICYLQIRNNTGKGEFFMPSTENRNIKKHLRVAFGLIGAILLVVAIGVFIVGGFDSLDNGDVAFTSCYKCDGIGRYEKNGVIVSCGSCNGSGIGAYKESGQNIMIKPALWLGAFGIGSLAMIKVLKDDE